MRIYFLILVSIVCLNVSFAQESNPLFRIIEAGKFGFINKQGKVVISSRFRYLGDFYEGLAVARLDSGYGFINQNGQFVIQPVYDYTKDFYDSLAIVISNSEPFFINKRGKIRPYSYEEDMANKKRCYELDSLLHFNKQSVPELLLCFDGETIQYKTRNDKIVWKQNSMRQKSLHKLNLDHRIQQDLNCTEFPPKINHFNGSDFKLDSQGIVLKVFPDENVLFSDSLVGIKMRLFNNYPYPDDTIFFASQTLLFICK